MGPRWVQFNRWADAKMPTRLKILLAVAALSACADDVSFPEKPPRKRDHLRHVSPKPVDRVNLIRLAAPGARDCGTAQDKTTADAVYRCSSAELARRRPFYCRFEPAAAVTDRSPTANGVVWGIPAAFVGKEGQLFRAEVDDQGRPTARQVPLNGVTLYIGSGMTKPVLKQRAAEQPRGGDLNGLVLIETVVGADGIVKKAAITRKVASEPVNAAAMRLVTDEQFEPARFFGTPVAAYWTFTVEIRADRIQLASALPNSTQQLSPPGAGPAAELP